MLTVRELTTIRAALLFWREEMHTPALMQPYVEPPGADVLSVEEVDDLRDALQPDRVRFALCDAADQLMSLQVYTSPDETLTLRGDVRWATVLLPTP